ncbi:MAG: family 65 glycosyl hydrolase, partial [Thermoleophilia bacterium]|nr:family 65 glycosyl hydrolase [Thermoleophilia bacterium]
MNHQLAPWEHREEGWPPDDPGLSETMLALTNGYLGVRGTLDEGSPAVTPGTYLGGFHEVRDIPYSERGYGDPELDQVLVGVADGTRIRLLVEGKPLDLRSGTPLRHERTLDLRTGVLTRTLRWRSPRGDEVEVRSRRLVSLVHRELAAIEYVVEPVRGPLRLLVHSELVAEPPSQTGADDPRASAPLPRDTLVPRLAEDWERGAVLVHETRRSRNAVAAAMEHEVLGPAGRLSPVVRAGGDMARWSLAVRAAAGRPLRIVKLLAYHWAPGGDPRALARAVRRTLEALRGCGFDALVEAERAALDEVWMRADIEIDGDPELQHAIRYATFQLHRNAARAEGRAIPAKGLTGPGYSGHTFWDMEIFLLPVLTHCAPGHAEEALRWRAATLPKARKKAARLGLRGAAFPWRTIAGEECSGYLPAGTAAFHVTAAVAHAAARHVAATGDERFERE